MSLVNYPRHRFNLIGVWRFILNQLGMYAVILSMLFGLGAVFGNQGTIELSDHPELIVASQQAWGTLGLNAAAHAAHLPGAKLQIGSQTFEKGLGHHASGSITVLLDRGFSSFDCLIGLQPCGNDNGSVVFRVIVDGQTRFESGVIRSTNPPRHVHVDVEGASELRLEADDAGDGITCDMANWVNARLTPTTGPTPAADAPVDIVPFGRVVTYDADRLHGTSATRVDEFPAEDFLLSTELVPDSVGTYRVPVNPNGVACVGVEWLNRRAIKVIGIEVLHGADPSALTNTRVQGWFGESLWQGKWLDLHGVITLDGNHLAFKASTQAPTGGLLRTWKVRMLIPATNKTLIVKAPVVHTRSRWGTGAFRVELSKPVGLGAPKRLPSKARVEVIDGWLLEPTGGRLSGSGPATLRLRYANPSALLSELTLVRIHRGTTTTSVAIEDVLAKGIVYVPSAGLLICRADEKRTASQYEHDIAGQKTILERVREMPDQTFEQAMARTHRSAQNEGPVMLSLACDNAKVVVERNGDVRWQTVPSTTTEWLNRAASVRVQLNAHAKPVQTRKLLDGWLPVPVITTTCGSLELCQRVFVAPTDKPEGKPFRLNRPSVCVQELWLTNSAAEPTKVQLTLSFVGDVQDNYPAVIARLPRPNTFSIVHGDKVIGRLSACSGPEDIKVTSTNGAIIFAGTLPPATGLNATMYLALSGQPIPESVNPAELMVELERYWNDALDSAAQIEVPEPSLNNLVRSSRVRCLIDARNESQGECVAAWIAAMAYGPLESEAHSVIRGMDYLGHNDFARRALDYFIHRYNTNGFLTTGYTTFGTGWHLWTLGEHWRLTHDTNWLQSNASELARVGHWTLRQIAKTRRFTPSGTRVRGFGLMPPGVLADWNAFAQHFCMSAYYAAGLRELGDALAAICHPDARVFRSASRQLMNDIVREFESTSAEAPVVPLRNGTWVQFYPAQAHTPGMVARFFPGEDAGRSWAYNVELGAHQMIPTGVLAPNAARVTHMLEHMEDSCFLQDGWFDYQAAENERDWFNLGGFAKVQPFYCRNAEIYAMRDEVKPFLRSYFNSTASLLNEEVLTFWEHFNHSGAWDKTHETGYFLYQSRIMLVHERNDELWLAPLIPARWLEHGKQIKVANVPTFFGPVSYTMHSHVSHGYILASVSPPTRTQPQHIVIRFRHPEGKPLRGLELDGKTCPPPLVDNFTLRLKPQKRAFTIKAIF